jgi:hypothetical protein
VVKSFWVKRELSISPVGVNPLSLFLKELLLETQLLLGIDLRKE